MAPARLEDEECSGPSSPSQEQEPAPEDEDSEQATFESTASDLGSDVERRTVKRVVDWTLAIEELRAKRRRGGGLQDDPDHRC